MQNLQGQLLISSAGLYDPNFRHTVVLIGAHGDEGALGVVLNRPAGVAIADAAPPLMPITGREAMLYQGGPVQPDQPVLLAELSDPTLADVHVFDAIGFLTGELSETARIAIRRARVYAGYSGWGPGQLEDEMAADTWIVEPPRVEDVFTDDPDGLWKRILQRKGPRYKHISMMPFDPRVN